MDKGVELVNSKCVNVNCSFKLPPPCSYNIVSPNAASDEGNALILMHYQISILINSSYLISLTLIINNQSNHSQIFP